MRVWGSKMGMREGDGTYRALFYAHTGFLTRGPDCLLTSLSADISNSSSSLILFSLSGSSWHGCEEEEPGGRGGKRDRDTYFTDNFTRLLWGPEFHQAKPLKIQMLFRTLILTFNNANLFQKLFYNPYKFVKLHWWNSYKEQFNTTPHHTHAD